ncbi:MAG TPA: hypothetical protein VLG50_03885 [Candidatus Saccharimonadales bacterium]|nr:hypothetical protein [Candidatus Saccharimonadales bacterium]
MKIIKLTLLSLSIVLPDIVQAELILLDRIDCVVCGPERNTAFVDTDSSWKRDLNGKFIELSKQIQQEIVNQQVISEKMPMDPSAAQKYIEGLKTQHNLTDADLVAMFAEVGRLAPEGLALLHDQYVQEFFAHYKFKSQLVATDDEINEYYNEFPEFIEGWVELQVAQIPYEASSREKVKKDLETFISTDKSQDLTPNWSDAIHIANDEIAKDVEFVLNMDVGKTLIHETDGKFELYKLTAKEPTKLKPLAECRSAIIERLNRKKLEKMLHNHNETVREFIDIIQLGNKEITLNL